MLWGKQTNKNQKPEKNPNLIDPSTKVSGILLCSMVWFKSVPGFYIAANTLGGRRIKRRKSRSQHRGNGSFYN